METKKRGRPSKKTTVTYTTTGDYTAIVRILGKVYESKGSTILEAISGLRVNNCKGRALLSLKKGDVIKEKILMPSTAFRLFNGMGITREIALKNASTLFQGL